MSHPSDRESSPNVAMLLGPDLCQWLAERDIDVVQLKGTAASFPLPEHMPSEEFWRGDIGTEIFDCTLGPHGCINPTWILRGILANPGPASSTLVKLGLTEQLLNEFITTQTRQVEERYVSPFCREEVMEALALQPAQFDEASVQALALTRQIILQAGMSIISPNKLLLMCLLIPYERSNKAVAILHKLRAMAPSTSSINRAWNCTASSTATETESLLHYSAAT